MNQVKKLIEDYGYEDVLILEEPAYETAFIGVSLSNQAVYDYDKMIEYLIQELHMTLEEAADFIYWNDSFKFEGCPIIIQRME